MTYFLIVIGGIVVAVLLLAQLRNEARAQSRQIQNMFENLVIEVYGTPTEESPSPGAPTHREPLNRYAIGSTSITVGREDGKKRYQLDLPIATADRRLAGTAAEITIDPDDGCLRLFIRRLEQPVIWVYTEGDWGKPGYLRCLVSHLPEAEDPKTGRMVPQFPEVPPLYAHKKAKKMLYQNNDRCALWVNDEVLLGDTVLRIVYNGGEG